MREERRAQRAAAGLARGAVGRPWRRGATMLAFAAAAHAQTPVAVQPPNLGGAVAGTAAGAGQVSPSGTATYSVPIPVPPGTAGLQPSLSLNYDSRGPDGALGLGWSVEGLPAITRCAARPLVISCGTQQSKSLIVVEPGGHVGRLPLSLSTCPRGAFGG